MTSIAREAFTTEDVVYHNPAGAPLLARLYRPSTPGPHPAVVDVHGGRWCAETRLTNVAIDEMLASSGVFVMALDFRMPPVVQYPLPVADINGAIRWLHAHAADLGIDRAQIGGVGTSSGGHQLLLNALKPNDPLYAQDQPAELAPITPALAYIVLGWPVTDPVARYAYARERKMEIHVQSHDAYWPSEADMAQGSPLRIVTEGEQESLPPALLVQGGDDVILSPGMSERFAEAYRAAGGELDLRIYPGQPHTFITKTPDAPASQQALADIRDFILARAAALTGSRP
jgi:acetyl esterase/lipase